jgi:hypothetical protein
LALPQRSPNPFMVPWTWPTPSITAVSEFATAHSASCGRECRGAPSRARAPRARWRPARREAFRIGVAEDEPGGPGRLGRRRVCAAHTRGWPWSRRRSAGVEHDLFHAWTKEPDAVRDHVEVLVERGAEGVRDVEVPALPTMVATGAPASMTACSWVGLGPAPPAASC